MKDNIKKIREIQIIAATLLRLEPELKLYQANSDVIDLFVELPIDGARFAVFAWVLDKIDADEYNSYKDALNSSIQDLYGCPLYFSHYDEEQGLLISPIANWDFSELSINQDPQFSLLNHKNMSEFFYEIRRQDHQIKILRDHYRMVVKTICLNEDRRGFKCKAEMVYLRDFTLDYKMHPKKVTDRKGFQRNLYGQPQDEYPHDLLDDKILESVRIIYPRADVHNSLLVTSTEYRSLLRYRNYQNDYAEFRFLPDISQIPTILYPQLGNLEGAKFTFDIFMLMRPDKKAFANECFELKFPLQGWFNTLSQLVRKLDTMHRVIEIIK